MEIVRVENLTFTYPEATSAALTAVNLSLVPGEFVTLCGKSAENRLYRAESVRLCRDRYRLA